MVLASNRIGDGSMKWAQGEVARADDRDLDGFMAILRLRQWTVRRLPGMRCGLPERGRPSRRCWQEKAKHMAEASIVSVIDFERVMGSLPAFRKALLLLIYRDGLSHAEAAKVLGCSQRTVATALPEARRGLARALDRLGLL